MIHSDWHIHSEHSYDASLPLETLAQAAREQGLVAIGITDHLNFNDESFLANIKSSAEGVKEAQKKHPFLVLGVELTPIEKPQFDYIAKTGTREGYVPPATSTPYPIMLGLEKKELMALGVRYAVGAAHWRVDLPNAKTFPPELDACIKEWYRQQLFLACDERVTVLGHPWYHGRGIWYEDFSVIPHAMNEEIGAALKQNGKYVECNSHFFTCQKTSEKFRHQYAEFLRELFEMGIPVTYGSDMHDQYPDLRETVETYLRTAGFAEGDFSEISPRDFW